MHYRDYNTPNITRKDIFDVAREQLPEVEENLGETVGAYHLFGNLALYLEENVGTCRLNDEFISRAFGLMNKMASHNDPEVQNILIVGFMEVAVGNERIMPLLREHFSPEGLSLLERVISED
jgi:hypothetical protein